jgi:hypothetical protein
MKKQDSATGDWRGKMLARIRTVITEADPDIVEERKWRKLSNGMVKFQSGRTTGSSAPVRPTRTTSR